jgi:peptide deformylase
MLKLLGFSRLDAYEKSLLFTGLWTILVGFLFHRTDGIGLSAPQVGINVQLMVFNPVGERGEGEEIVLVNPRVNRYSKKMVLFNEGCLSFPQIYADVEVLLNAYLFLMLSP